MAWGGFNARHVLAKLPHSHVSELSSPTSWTTPKNSNDLLRHTRQVKLMLKGDDPVDREELLDVIERLERFGIAADKDQDLERVTLQKWHETAKLATPEDKRHIENGYGQEIDGKTLARLYKERQVADLKRAEKKRATQAELPLGKPPRIIPARPSKVKKVTILSPIEIVSSSDELEAWGTYTSSSTSSFTFSTPLPLDPPFTSHRAFPEVLRSLPSITPTPCSRVTRSSSKCI